MTREQAIVELRKLADDLEAGQVTFQQSTLQVTADWHAVDGRVAVYRVNLDISYTKPNRT